MSLREIHAAPARMRGRREPRVQQFEADKLAFGRLQPCLRIAIASHVDKQAAEVLLMQRLEQLRDAGGVIRQPVTLPQHVQLKTLRRDLPVDAQHVRRVVVPGCVIAVNPSQMGDTDPEWRHTIETVAQRGNATTCSLLNSRIPTADGSAFRFGSRWSDRNPYMQCSETLFADFARSADFRPSVRSSSGCRVHHPSLPAAVALPGSPSLDCGERPQVNLE